MTIENYFAEKLNKFQRKFNLNTVYSNPYHTAFGQVEESQENADHQIKLATMVRELQEDFADKYGKNKYIELGTKDIVDFADNIYNLIATAYRDKGGHFEFQSGQDVINSDLNYWIAADIDKDPEADVTIGGKKTNYGTKLTVMGQDGEKESKKSAVVKMIDMMKKKGFYAEMDEDLANKLGLEVVADEDIIRKVMSGKDLKFTGNGRYRRNISGAGNVKEKVLVGIPKV